MNSHSNHNIVTSNMKLIYQKGSDNFYLRKDVQGTRINVIVTDLKNLWRLVITEAELLKLFKAENPRVQASQNSIMTYIFSSMDSVKPDTSLDVADSKLSLRITNNSPGVKMKLTLVLDLQDSQEFFNEITTPLVAVVNQLVYQRSKLMEMVKFKDLELREYKLEGASISRKNVETTEMIEKEFLSESAEQFVDKVRLGNVKPELSLPLDLSHVFNEISRINVEDVPSNVIASTSDHSLSPEKPTYVNGSSSSPTKPSCKRPENQMLVQVPRTKQRKKNYNL